MHTRELLASGYGAPGVCRSAREDSGGQGAAWVPGSVVGGWFVGPGAALGPTQWGAGLGDAGEFGVRRLVEKPVL